MRDFNKNFIILILSLMLVFFIGVFIIGNYTGRRFQDGIEKAEIYHIVTGEYYNTYNVLGADSSYIKIEERASFEETYFDEIEGVTILKED